MVRFDNNDYHHGWHENEFACAKLKQHHEPPWMVKRCKSAKEEMWTRVKQSKSNWKKIDSPVYVYL